jgi:hypothetical protein
MASSLLAAIGFLEHLTLHTFNDWRAMLEATDVALTVPRKGCA